MAIKRYNGTAFSDAQIYKRFNGSSWQDVTIAKRWNGSAWVDLLTAEPVPVGTVTKTYDVSSIWTYLIQSGTQQSAHLHEPIQGTYDGSASHSRASILLFPYKTIQADLSGATIQKIELNLKRLSSSHGSSTAHIRVNALNYASAPTTWKGADLGNALVSTSDSATSLTLGQARWFPLLTSIGNGFKNGTIKSLCVDAALSTALGYYIKYSNKIQLRITYNK